MFGEPPHDAKPLVNFSLVMAVAASTVNRIVVSRIIEGAGLKAIACEAQAMLESMQRTMPCVVVAEEGAGESEQAALRRVAEVRARSANGLPLLVVLSRPGSALAARPEGEADAVVSMPFTPDRLAPVVLRLVERARKFSSS